MEPILNKDQIRYVYDKIKPDIVLSEDNLGNKLNKRMVGIKLGAYNNEINHVKLGPANAIYHAAHEVYFVSISSLKYIGGMIVGKADTSQFPPVVIGKNGYLLDGNHRLQAYKYQGIKRIKAYIGESLVEGMMIG